MSLVWHIVCKDFRRLRLPLGLWLLLMLAHTSLLWLQVGAEATPASLEGLRYFARTWGVIVALVGFVLAAWLVMEDSLVETRAFWPTRPICGMRLLVAKVVGAVLMFGLLPVLALTPLWLGCGFSLHEWGAAAREWALPQGLLSLAAFTLAAVTASAGQLLIRAAGLAVGVPLLVLFACGRIAVSPYLVVRPEFSGGLGMEAAKYGAALVLTIACAAALVIHQFLTRRTARSVGLVGLWFALLIGVRYGWGWDYTLAPDRTRQVDRSLKFSAMMTAPGERSNGREEIKLVGTVTGEPAETYVVPRAARGHWVWPDGQGQDPVWLRRTAGPGPRPPAAVVLQVAGLPPGPAEPAAWTLTGREVGERLRRTKLAAALTIDADVMHGRVLGKLPLRVDAALQVGAGRTRIEKLEALDDRIIVTMWERDGGTSETEDAFVLFIPSSNQGRVLDGRDLRTVRINSIQVGRRQLVLEAPTRERNGQTESVPDWEKEAVILKVRFSPVRVYAGPLVVSLTP